VRHPALRDEAFSPMTAERAEQFRPIVAAALSEDGASSDITSLSTIPLETRALADVVLRSGGVVAGLAIAALAFAAVDPSVVFQAAAHDGEAAPPATLLARVQGPARSLLGAERVALNLLGRLCGIATLTRAFVDAVRGLPVRICDTRKTTPGLRALERYAVRAGGGYNHRFSLSDAVLIKDNHLVAAGSVAVAVAAARAHAPAGTIIEVECDSIEQVRAALTASVDAVLLDNMTLDDMRRAAGIAHGRAVVEASGGVTLDNVREIASTGVDVISVGALTHSARCADVALDFATQAATASGRE
jgi:nicotinate-nucleotide pyrophosphorylase (carboxylating)